MSQVTLTVEGVADAALEHVLAALHREARFMREVGLVGSYEVETARA